MQNFYHNLSYNSDKIDIHQAASTIASTVHYSVATTSAVQSHTHTLVLFSRFTKTQHFILKIKLENEKKKQ